MTCVLDTHVLYWWVTDPGRISAPAVAAIESASDVAIADITWFELAVMVERGRVRLSQPIETWLARIAAQVTTVVITPAIAATAATLGRSFPADPADRLIYASAVVHGATLVTKDEQMRRHRHPTARVVW